MTTSVAKGIAVDIIYLVINEAFDTVSYHNLKAGWVDTEEDWKLAACLGPEGGC